MTTIKGGYVLRPRIVKDSPVSKMPPVVRELWEYLCREVNHSNNGKYKRGQGFFCLSDIQNDLCWYVGYRKMTYSKPQLTKAIRRLNEENMTATTKATRGIFVEVLNYRYYQDPKNYEGNDEEITKETRRKHEGTHLKQECKNVRNILGKDKSFPCSKEIEQKKKRAIEKQKKQELQKKSFDYFWERYPRKVAKQAAFKAWKKLKVEREFYIEVAKAAERQAEGVFSDREPDKIPYPATWINAGCWEDEIEDSNFDSGVKEFSV